MARYFGTDGIRGVAGEDLTAELAFRLGEAVGFLMHEEQWEPRVFIGGDSRISTPMLESALAAGLMSTGCDVYLGGILPTPGASISRWDASSPPAIIRSRTTASSSSTVAE